MLEFLLRNKSEQLERDFSYSEREAKAIALKIYIGVLAFREVYKSILEYEVLNDVGPSIRFDLISFDY